jgi:carboxylate-amine ligase
LVRLRQTAAAAAGKHGYAIMACGTHPTAQWPDSVQTRKDQYRPVAECLQMIGRRNMLCGMHVHVEFRDPRRRVDVMRRLLPYVPLFLALSTSSPFWRGTDTGLKGYRLAAYDELPRTGLPELFRTSDEYEAYVSALVRSGAIENSSRLWWTVRPSHKYPTLELRAPDCCPRLEDAVAIASLYRAVVRALYYDPERNADLDAVGRAIAVENKWRAQRNGVHGTFVTEIGGMSVEDVLGQLIEQVAPHAAALGCLDEVEHCRTIVSRGTGADAQLEIFRARGQSSPAEALQPVKRWIAETTAAT